jgi:hypothetical protein
MVVDKDIQARVVAQGEFCPTQFAEAYLGALEGGGTIDSFPALLVIEPTFRSELLKIFN